jgi:hypothetical protein
MIADSADWIVGDVRTLSSTPANATAARVPTAYSAVSYAPSGTATNGLDIGGMRTVRPSMAPMTDDESSERGTNRYGDEYPMKVTTNISLPPEVMAEFREKYPELAARVDEQIRRDEALMRAVILGSAIEVRKQLIAAQGFNLDLYKEEDFNPETCRHLDNSLDDDVWRCNTCQTVLGNHIDFMDEGPPY